MKKLYSFILFAALLTTTAVWSGEKTYSDMGFHITTPTDSSDDSSDVHVRLLVIDPVGNKVGYDPSIGAEVSQILQSHPFKERIGDIETGEPGLEGYNIIIGDPIAGGYTLQIFGEKASAYSLSIHTSDNDKYSKAQQFIFKGLTAPGVTSTYSIVYDPTPGVTPKVEKIVTITDAKNDVNIAYNLGLITNAGIEQSLLAKLDNAKKKIEQGNTDAAKNILNAFINEIEAQKDKHIKENAAKILIEGAQYIMDNL